MVAVSLLLFSVVAKYGIAVKDRMNRFRDSIFRDHRVAGVKRECGVCPAVPLQIGKEQVKNDYHLLSRQQ